MLHPPHTRAQVCHVVKHKGPTGPYKAVLYSTALSLFQNTRVKPHLIEHITGVTKVRTFLLTRPGDLKFVCRNSGIESSPWYAEAAFQSVFLSLATWDPSRHNMALPATASLLLSRLQITAWYCHWPQAKSSCRAHSQSIHCM